MNQRETSTIGARVLESRGRSPILLHFAVSEALNSSSRGIENYYSGEGWRGLAWQLYDFRACDVVMETVAPLAEDEQDIHQY